MMSHISRVLKMLVSTALVGLMAIMVTLGGLTTRSAFALPNAADDAMLVAQESSSENQGVIKDDRLKAIEDCIPEELTLQNDDAGDRLARALGEMTNDQIERAFNLTDNPELSDAEAEFERCLERKGYTPQRQQSS
ncbi:MAG TPA: hypothetical protein ACFE0H_01650 [Elainellaceae cyanobacterium]